MWCAELPKKMPPTAPNVGSWLDRRLDRPTVGLGGCDVDRRSVSAVMHAQPSGRDSVPTYLPETGRGPPMRFGGWPRRLRQK
jgi:hypothetical protein